MPLPPNYEWDQSTLDVNAVEFNIEGFKEVFKALSKNKQCDFLGHANDIYLFFGLVKELLQEKQA